MSVKKTITILKHSVGLRFKHLMLFSFIKTNSFFVKRSLPKNVKTFNKPIFLLGHLRSGTTFTHRFLSKSEALLSMTLEPMILGAGRYRNFIHAVIGKKLRNLSLDKVYDPKIHKTGFQLPESDDIAMYFQHFKGLLYWIYFEAWQLFDNQINLRNSIDLAANDDSFLSFQQKLYTSKIDENKEKRILSKSFFGVFQIEKILERYPDAKIILLQRDPKEVIPSTLSLEISIQENLNNFSKQPQKLKERYIKNLYEEMVYYYQKTDELIQKKLPNVYVVEQHKLLSDFKATMEALLAFLELKDDEVLRNAIEEHAEKQRDYKSQHQYSLADYNLTNEQIDKDFQQYYKNLG